MDLSAFIQSASSLFRPEQKGLLCVSGGIDSVVLLHLAHQARLPFHIAHCNFHLRPSDCDCDEAFVRSLAARYGAPIHVAHFDTRAHAASHHLSVEEAARQQRYAFFEEVRQREGLDYIATAHHRDDAAETFFINLLRGSGIAGLRGIPARNGHVVRPLLPFSRQEIEAYADLHRLDHVEDSTNATTLYLRNRIRHQLLPLLRQISPQADQALQRTMRHLADTEMVYRQSIDSLRQSLITHGSIAIADVDRLHPQRTLLFELLRPYGVTAPQVDDLLADLHRPTRATYRTPSHLIHRFRGKLLLEPLGHSAPPVSPAPPAPPVPPAPPAAPSSWTLGPLRLALHAAPLHLQPAPGRVYFDASLVQFPLRLRHWREGDRFHPFGLRGTQLLSDYFTSRHFTPPQRAQALLLVDAADTILWLVGHRAAHLPVTPASTLILEATLEA